MSPRYRTALAAFCATLLSGCSFGPNEGTVTPWYRLRAGDPPTRVAGHMDFEDNGQRQWATSLMLRFRDASTKTYAARVERERRSSTRLYSLALTPRSYELYQFEVTYLSYSETRETGRVTQTCKTVTTSESERKKHKDQYTEETTTTCDSVPEVTTQNYYATYVSPQFSAPVRVLPYQTNFFGDLMVQCDYDSSQGRVVAKNCRLLYGGGDDTDVMQWLTKEAKKTGEPIPPLQFTPLDTTRAGGIIQRVN